MEEEYIKMKFSPQLELCNLRVQYLGLWGESLHQELGVI